MSTHPNEHIVKSYDEEQHRLVAEIVHMGELRWPSWRQRWM